jgi:hypothetical protein
MAKLVNRREMMFSVGGVMVAGAIAGCAAPVPAEAPPASGTIALPPARNTGTLESKTVPRTAWTRTVDNPVRNLAYADGRVFVSTLSETMALDASTGRELWSVPLLTQGSGRAIANGTWYAFGGYTPDPFTLLAVDCASGRVQWTYTPPRGVSLSGPISTPLNGALYVTVNNDAVQNMQVWAIDVATRQVRWTSLCRQGNTDVYAPAAGTHVLNLDHPGAGRVWLLIVLVSVFDFHVRFRGSAGVRDDPGVPGCAPVPTAPGWPPFRVAGMADAGQAGAGRAEIRCQQVTNASFHRQSRLILRVRRRAWRTSLAGTFHSL